MAIDIENQTDLNNQRSLFVTGDDGQLIYSFRGSVIDLILNFEEFYPNSKEIILNQNYRSTKAILDLAEKILSLNPRQKFKELFTENPSKTLDVTYSEQRASNSQASHSGISNMFDIYLDTASASFSTGNLWQNNNGYNHYNPSSWSIPKVNWDKYTGLNDIAVLYRTHAQSQALEAMFNSNQLPYRLVSGTRFLDRKEVKDVISILKFAFNSQDKLAISRFLPLILEGVRSILSLGYFWSG